ncbi:MAG: phage major capsid protein [Pseudomonadota bacterium]
MKTLEELRKELAELVNGIDPLVEKVAADDASQDDLDALTKHNETIEKKKTQIKAVEDALAAKKNAALPAGDPVDEPEGGSARAPAKAANKKLDAQEKLGLLIMGTVRSHKTSGRKDARGVVDALNELNYSRVADEFATSTKAMESGTPADGGVLVPEQWNEEIVPILYEQATFMQGNPRELPMPRGNINEPAGLASATASYRAEGGDISVSQPTLRSISLSAKLLSGIVPVTNQLMRWSMGAASEFVRTDLTQAMSLKMDSMAYLGTGAGNDPLGIFNATGVYSTAAAAGTTPTVAVIDAAARGLRERHTRYAGIRAGSAWVMSPRTIDYLRDLRGADSKYIFPELQSDENPRWKGFPVLVSGTIPENLGAGTNETYLALVSFPNTLFGNSKSLTLQVSSEATIMPSGPTGDPVSMFSTDSTAVRATMEHDFDIRYTEAVNVLTGVQWGA